jgi:ABC-type transporter Mla subunit MlaD
VHRKAERNRNRLMAMMVIAIAFVVFAVLFFSRHASMLLDARTIVKADFRTTTGLRPGSPVQLAGLEVGHVERTDFVWVQYQCDPLTEDVGALRSRPNRRL